MMIQWWDHSQKGVTDRQTDRRAENTIHRAKYNFKRTCVNTKPENLMHRKQKKDRQFDNFVVTDGIVNGRNANLRCHQWRQSCQIDDRLFSVFHMSPLLDIEY